MNTLLKFFSFFSIVILMQACVVEQPLSVNRADNNRTYTVEYLFEHDGCKLYRFRDNGNYVYFSNCNGNVTSVINDSVQIKTYTKNR
jgi:hypothetical protein